MTEMIRGPAVESTLLNMMNMFVNSEGLLGNIMVGGHLRHSNHKIMEFSVSGGVKRRVSRTVTLDFEQADFGVFWKLVDRISWEAALKGKGVQEGRTFFKKEVLKSQEQAIPRCQKDESVRNKAGLAELRDLARTKEKKESLWSLEKKG